MLLAFLYNAEDNNSELNLEEKNTICQSRQTQADLGLFVKIALFVLLAASVI